MPVDIRLTYDDYCLLPDDGKRYEIIDGELFVTPSPRRSHQKVVTRLTSYLNEFAERSGCGEVYVAPFDVVFSMFDVVEPDILYVSKEHASVLTEKNVQGAPDLVWRSFPKPPQAGTAQLSASFMLATVSRNIG